MNHKPKLLKPNARTTKAMQAARRGELIQSGKPARLLSSLNVGNIKIEEGSGNVFADLGLPNPEERLTKADLAMQIATTLQTRRLTQAKAASLFGIDQPKISRLLRGQLSGFSTERLIHFLPLLGQDVVIVVKPAAPHSRKLGHVSVVAEARL